MSHRLRTLVGAASTLGLIGVIPIATASAVSAPDDAVFISELHYDNDGTDEGEAIEVFGPAGTDLAGWTLALYNGSTGALYDTDALPASIPDLNSTGYGVVVVAYPPNGIQNGSPDGIALVDDVGTVRQFLSYEGSLTASNGPAAGLQSTDIGVSQPSNTPIGESVQLVGEGACYGALDWAAPAANTFGALGNLTPNPSVPCEDEDDGDPLPPVRINEIHYDNASTDANEAVEVVGPAGSDLTGWSLVRYNGNGGASYGTDSLSGTLADLGNGTGVTVVAYATNGLQNGSPDGIALVDPAGDVVEFLSYEGTMTATGGPAAGLTSTDIGVAESGSTLADQSLQRSDTGSWAGPLCHSFGALNDPDAEEFCPAEFEIYEIQGSGDASPMIGRRAIIDGVVVSDFQNSDQLNGFHVQEIDGDGDPATSDGIFVFEGGSTVDVSVGDVVTVAGRVAEFNGLTEITSVTSVEKDGTAPLPLATEVVLPVANSLEYEAVEGMYVTFPQDLAIGEYFNFDRFGEIVLTFGRQIQPTALVEPGDAANALAAEQALARIMLDDGRSVQNPDPARHPDGAPFTLDNRFRGGDEVTNATGVMDYSFGQYRIQPTQGADYTSVNERTAEHDDVGGNLEVASFNVLNYFQTIDSGPDVCGPAQNLECRGADNATERERQLAKIVAAMDAMDADVLGIIEVENTTGVEAMGDIVDRLNTMNGAGTYAYLDTGTIGSDAIKVGFIYQPARATPVGDYAILDSTVDPRFDDTKSRPALAQTFLGNEGSLVTVAVNHLKSKGSSCASIGDPDAGDGQGNCNQTRTRAAEALADWMENDPTGTGVEASLIIGDLNAYDKEDPIDALREAGYTDLVASFGGEYAYSYVFDGKIGYLDHGLADELLEPRVTGTTVWHINADEPDLIDYDTSFKRDAQDALYAPDPYRSSDHDPVIVGAQYDVDDIIGDMTGIVADLRASGDLNAGQAKALTQKLDQSLVQIQRGNVASADDILGAVEDQLADFVGDGILTPEEVAALLASIGAVRSGL